MVASKDSNRLKKTVKIENGLLENSGNKIAYRTEAETINNFSANEFEKK